MEAKSLIELKPPIALAQTSRPIAQPRKTEEPPPPPRAPIPPPPPPSPPDLSKRPVAKQRVLSGSRPAVQPRKQTPSEDDQKKLDTALRVARQSMMDIDDTIVEFQRVDAESDRTVDNMHAKFHTVLVGDSLGKKYMEIVHHNRNIIQTINAEAETKANNAKVAKAKVEEAHKAKRVNEAQTQTNIIKDLKRDIVEDLKPRIEKSKDLMLENYGKLLEWEQEEILKAMNSKAKELLREVETAYSAIFREYDTLLNVKQELDGAKFEKNSVGDRLKIELLKRIKEGDELFKDKAQKINHKAILERIAIEEAMAEKKGDILEEIIDRLQSYRDEFMGDEETIGLKSAMQNIGYEVGSVFYSTVKLMIPKPELTPQKEAPKQLKEEQPQEKAKDKLSTKEPMPPKEALKQQKEEQPQETPKEKLSTKEPVPPKDVPKQQQQQEEKSKETSKQKEKPARKEEKPKMPSTTKPTVDLISKVSATAVKEEHRQTAQAKPSTPIEMEIALSKADLWPIPASIETSSLGKNEKKKGSLQQKRIPQLSRQQVEMKEETDKADKWPGSTSIKEDEAKKEEKEIFDNRKKEILARIKQLLDIPIEYGVHKNLRRAMYQQIYLHYDEALLHRFFLWSSDVNVATKIEGVELSKQLAYILGFVVHPLNNLVMLNEFAKYPPDIAPLHSFYVYAPNLIANTIIGNTYGPLLRIVNIAATGSHNTNGKVEEIIYSPENFHGVQQKHISEIQIQILSDSGRPIEFNSGNCILTLHFKRSIF